MKKSSKYIVDIIIISAILLWTAFLIYFSPEIFIEIIGARNGYILVFITTLLGGITTINVLSVYPPLIMLASGGLNPFVLGIIAGIGLTIANSLFFYVGHKGRRYTESKGKFRKYCNSAKGWFNRRKTWQIYLIILAYVGFSPLPNNVLTASGGFIDFSFRKIAPPLLIGNIIFMSILAYFGSIGISLIL